MVDVSMHPKQWGEVNEACGYVRTSIRTPDQGNIIFGGRHAGKSKIGDGREFREVWWRFRRWRGALKRVQESTFARVNEVNAEVDDARRKRATAREMQATARGEK